MKKKNYQRYFLKHKEPPTDSDRTRIEMQYGVLGMRRGKALT
jgi:hypothetical protein